MLALLGDVQIPLLAAMLLGGCASKLARALRGDSISADLAPTALFPLRLRGWASAALCAIELLFGLGLILTSGRLLDGPAAELIRLGTGLLFVIATCALIEVRSIRPSAGCGCFGEFSTAPITGRTLARSALLAVAALGIIELPPIDLPRTPAGAVLLLGLFTAEVVVFGTLSPEVRGLLVRIGYSTQCERRLQSTDQTLARLQRSTQWRRHSDLIAGQQPADVWRELCWRYIVFPSTYAGRDADLVFAVYLEHRRPMVRSVLVDSATGAVLPWPAGAADPAGSLRAVARWPALRYRRADASRPISGTRSAAAPWLTWDAGVGSAAWSPDDRQAPQQALSPRAQAIRSLSRAEPAGTARNAEQ